MIDFLSALQLMRENAWVLPTININTADALGLHLAHDLRAPIDLPPFVNAAVDGYAVRANEITIGIGMPVIHAIRAGAQDRLRLMPQSCAKIMTGAPLP